MVGSDVGVSIARSYYEQQNLEIGSTGEENDTKKGSYCPSKDKDETEKTRHKLEPCSQDHHLSFRRDISHKTDVVLVNILAL